MTERYIEITCDVCGEPEWSGANDPPAEFFAYQRERGWRFWRHLAMCFNCFRSGRTWRDATLHSGQAVEVIAALQPDPDPTAPEPA